MKKKFFGVVLVVAIAVGAMTNVNLNHSNKYSALTLKSIESLAGGEIYCFGDPVKNKGKCVLRVSGYGSECVSADSGTAKDCFGSGEVY